MIYELFNEPDNRADAAGWAVWKNGGGGYVGHQQLLTQIRNLGAPNVILADGAQMSEILPSSPLLVDPLASVGYAVHPYYMASIVYDPAAWDKRFGNLASVVPVVATEWNAQTGNSFCRSDDPEMAAKLLPYLQARNIGIYGWALDLPNTLIKDWSYTPTNFDNFDCAVPGSGAGALLKASFLR